LKALLWDDQGLVLYDKRLEGGRFVWPQTMTGTVGPTKARLSMLLEGIDWRAGLDRAMLAASWSATGSQGGFCRDEPYSRCSLAKVTSRIEFALATPALMMAPMSEGTENVMPVTMSMSTITDYGPGQAEDDHERIGKDWKFTASRR
jgi:IS66 Orf2 like protein